MLWLSLTLWSILIVKILLPRSNSSFRERTLLLKIHEWQNYLAKCRIISFDCTILQFMNLYTSRFPLTFSWLQLSLECFKTIDYLVVVICLCFDAFILCLWVCSSQTETLIQLTCICTNKWIDWVCMIEHNLLKYSKFESHEFINLIHRPSLNEARHTDC